MPGRSILFHPGDEVPVRTEDAGNGVPAEGDVVEVTGEGSDLTTVGKVQAQGNEGVGVVVDTPSDEDGNLVAGPASVLLAKPVVGLTETTAGSVAAGDEVQEDAGGTIIGFDSATTQTSTPLGQAFAANAGKYGFTAVGEVAVALYR